MANILGVTNPVPGVDGTNNRAIPVSPNDTQIQNVPDPTRVGRPDARTDQEDTGRWPESDRTRYDSNFQTFLERLRQSPSLAQSLAKLFAGQGTLVTSGLGEGTAQEIAKALEMLRMDEAQLLRFLNGQFRSGTRFGGALFALLRTALAKADSEGMRSDILRFLKCYGDFSGTKHIEGNLLRNLRGMADATPGGWSEQLRNLAAQLENGIAAGDRQGNLALLKGSVFPFMSEYVDRTHDIGLARSLLTLMSLDIARYENGSAENLLQLFHQLNGYTGLREKLGGIGDEALLELLKNSDFYKASQNNQFADHLAASAARALRGEGSAQVQEIFREIVGAMLVNESVYMPLTHLLIPLEWDGRMLFSELWVDPDAQEKGGGQEEKSGRTTKILFKMDVQDLGAFDIVLTSRERTVSMKVLCPEKLVPFTKQIRETLTEILTRNGLQAEDVEVRKMGRPLTLTEVFPKIYEGKNSINVKV